MNKRIKTILANLSADGLLISKAANIFYLTNFAGFSEIEREAYLLLTKKHCYIFTDGRYSEVIKKDFSEFKLVETSPKNTFQNNLKTIITKEKIKKLAIDENDLRVSEFIAIRKITKITSDKNIVENLREIKDEQEILEIKEACKIGDLAFDYILNELKTNVTEIEIAKRIEIFILTKNASLSFTPIVAFGKHSSSPHHVSSDTRLKKNEIVLLDFGVRYQHYCSDMTRTIFFGKAPAKFKKIYSTVLNAQEKAVHLVSAINNEPLTMNNIDTTARQYIELQGHPSIPHSLGHGIGLEVHEKPSLSPKSKDKLKNGMVFSIEPGIYLPNIGGVRIEDLFCLQNNKLNQLTNSKKELIEL